MKNIIAIAALLLISSCTKEDIKQEQPKQSNVEVTVIEKPVYSDSVYNVILRP